jgi:aminoglycoside phosphotransferase (APT) family kinase protein
MEGMSSQPAGTREPVSATLAAWLSERLGEAGPFELTYLSGGNSNETLLLETPGRKAILRRPPKATLSPSAHSMEREFRVLTAVADTEVPAPRPLALAGPDDEGGPFLLMECVEGFAILDDLPPDYPPGLDSLRAVGEATVEALAQLHSVDWRAAGLEGFGRPDGFIERQVGRWRGQFESYQVREIADFDWLAEWLEANRPPAGEPGILHGDFHLDNCLFTLTPPIGVRAIIDWEMATIGDPLVDLGLLLGLWGPERRQPPAIDNLQGASRVEGAPSREGLAAHYAEHSGRSVEHLDWYMCLALWKLGAVIEGAYAHYVKGNVDSEYAKSLGTDIPQLMAEARAIAERG